MPRKHDQKTLNKMDAADEKSHPMEKVKEPAYISLECTKVLNTRLLRCLKESNASSVAERWEWEMQCPICKCTIGYWICAVDTSKVTLSGNQQRKNRNTALFAKSHYKKYHALENAISLVESHQHRRSTLVAQSKPNQDTPGPPALPPKPPARHSQGVKRKSGNTVHPAVSKKSRAHVGPRDKTEVSERNVSNKSDESNESDESDESDESEESVEESNIRAMSSKMKSDSKQVSHLSKQANSYPIHDQSAYHSGALIPICTKATDVIPFARSANTQLRKNRMSKALEGVESRESNSNEGVKEVVASVESVALSELELDEDKFRQLEHRAVRHDVEAQELVAVKYENDGWSKKAFCLCQKAATAGRAVSQYRLARMHHQGEGTKQSYTDAFQWYLKAAEQGHSLSQLHIGEMYEFGKGGVERCLEKAREWYQLVIEDSRPDRDNTCVLHARCNLTLMNQPDVGAHKHSLANIRLFHEAAGQGHVRAMHEVGIFLTSNGRPWECQKGLRSLEKAAECNYGPSLYSLGRVYWQGKVVPRHLRNAAEYWTKAAEQGHSEAAYHLGNLFAEDGSEMQSLKDAAAWWSEAATQGHADAQYHIATLCESGAYSHVGVKQSSEAASQWYGKAAAQGHIASRQKLEQATLMV